MHITQKIRVSDQFTTTVDIVGPNDAKQCILFSHGFGVGRDSRGMFTDLVEPLSDQYVCILFDYTRIDEQNNTHVYSYSLMQKTLRAIIEYITDNYSFSQTHLVAHSMGCILGMEQAMEFETRVLLAPSATPLGGRLKQYFLNRSGTVENPDGSLAALRSDGKTTTVSDVFFTELEFRDPCVIYRNAPGKTHVLVAQDDEILGETESILQSIAHLDITSVQGDHNFTQDQRLILVKYIQGIFVS